MLSTTLALLSFTSLVSATDEGSAFGEDVIIDAPRPKKLTLRKPAATAEESESAFGDVDILDDVSEKTQATSSSKPDLRRSLRPSLRKNLRSATSTTCGTSLRMPTRRPAPPRPCGGSTALKTKSLPSATDRRTRRPRRALPRRKSSRSTGRNRWLKKLHWEESSRTTRETTSMIKK